MSKSTGIEDFIVSTNFAVCAVVQITLLPTAKNPETSATCALRKNTLSKKCVKTHYPTNYKDCNIYKGIQRLVTSCEFC